jgi:hypothetical protein
MGANMAESEYVLSKGDFIAKQMSKKAVAVNS